MFLNINLCDTSAGMWSFYIVKTFINIVCIVIPLIIIVNSFRLLFGSVITADKIKDNAFQILKSVIAGLIVFFIPTMMNFVFGTLIEFDDSSLTECYTSSSMEKVQSLREKEAQEKEEKRKQQEKENKKALEEKAKDEKKKREQLEENEHLREQQEKDKNSSPGSSNNNVSPGTKTIHIGDSRTVGMCAAITGDWGGCSFNGTPKIYNDDIFIAKSAMGYSWFNSTAIGAVNNILNSNSNTTYNIISYMGVNYLLGDIDKYIPKYNELANGSWKGHNIILVSVNPVNESVEAQHGYGTKNKNIITFNNKLKDGISANNVKYCDVYNSIINNFQTTDGLHYKSDTYKQIFSNAKGCI